MSLTAAADLSSSRTINSSMIFMLSSVALTMTELVRGSAVMRTISCARARGEGLPPPSPPPPRPPPPPPPIIRKKLDIGFDWPVSPFIVSFLKTSLSVLAVSTASAFRSGKTRIFSSAEALTSMTRRIRHARLIPSDRPVRMMEFE